MADADCQFDRLFTISVPHILERIFFSLDYDSFMSSRKVSKAWNELHSCESYQQRRAELLVEKLEKAWKKEINERKLCKYSYYGNVEEVKNLLSYGVNPNCEHIQVRWGRTPWTPILHAAAEGNVEVVKLLLNAGADANVVHVVEGDTPLHKAIFNGGKRQHVVQLLLDGGADCNKADKRGEYPLHWAALRGRPEVVKKLLDAGAHLDVANIYGYTPLYRAVKCGHLAVVYMLLQAGADPNITDNLGRSPHEVTGDKNIVQLLLEAGAEAKRKRVKYM